MLLLKIVPINFYSKYNLLIKKTYIIKGFIKF